MPRNSGIKTERWLASAAFVRIAAPRTRSSIWSKFSRDVRSMERSLCMFVDLEKAYDRVPRDKLWKVLGKYGVDDQFWRAVTSFYCRPEVCVWVNGKQSKPFPLGVGLRQVCVLPPLLFIVYINWINKCSQADECATIGNCKISRLLFADNLVLLSIRKSGLKRASNSFADACDTAGMKISTAKSSFKKPWSVRVATEWSDTEAGREVQVSWGCIYEWRKTRRRTGYPNRQGKCSNASFALFGCHKTRIVKKGKALNFQNSFVPILTYGHESTVMPERVRSKVQASEMTFLQRIKGVTLFNKVRSSEIQKSLNIEPLLLRIERSTHRWFGHVSRMPQKRLPKLALLA